MKIGQLSALACLYAAGFAAQAASFDCGKAQTLAVHAVCGQRLVPMGPRGEIQEQQLKWLQLRDQCRDNLSCLSDVYRMRQQKLDLYMERIYRQGPF